MRQLSRHPLGSTANGEMNMNNCVIRRFTIVLWILFQGFIILPAQRAIPEDNLAYPVLIEISGRIPASGVFINDTTKTFLVTAKHVFLDSLDKPWAPTALLTAYPPDTKSYERTKMIIDLNFAIKTHALLIHPKQDIVAVQIGTADSSYIYYSPHIKLIENAAKGIVGARKKTTKTYEETLIGNEIFIMGYPSALGINQEKKQFDYTRPLLRKGIVAGKYDSLKTIILDCPVYYGNSGSPVIQVDRSILETKYALVGIVIEFVPFDERFANEKFGLGLPFWSNSGYSVAVPIESALELISKKP